MLRKVHAGALFFCCLLLVQCGGGRELIEAQFDTTSVPDAGTKLHSEISEVGRQVPETCQTN
jgi:hypothetical protein